MKKIACCIVLLILFLITSCNETTIEIINMEKINGEYYFTVDESVELITITDYVLTNDVYEIKCEPDSLKIVASSIYLVDGENMVTIKQGDKEFILHFYKQYNVSVEFVDEDNNPLCTMETLVNSKLSMDDILSKLDIPNGYYWDGIVIYNEEEINIEDLTVFDSIKITPIFKVLEYEISIKDEYDYSNEYILTIKLDEVIEYNAAEIPGYHYIGLFGDNGIIEPGSKYNPNMGKNLIAKYSPNKYQITYKYDGIEKRVDVYYGQLIEEFIPTKKGHTFNGWKYLDNIFNNNYYVFTSDIILIGEFIPNTYKITYQCDFGWSIKYVEYGASFTHDKLEIFGYKFIGWYLDGKLYEDTIYQFDYDITLMGKFEKDESQVIVELNLELFGGESSYNGYTDSSGMINLPTPNKEGFEFLGWYYDINYQNEVINLNYQDYNNEVLYAKYKHKNESYIESFVISKFNEHISTYDVLTMFDSTQSGFTSKYWHKIGIKLIGTNYYVSGVAQNGESLSILGEYDFVILAYSEYDLYKEFSSMGLENGYTVIFSESPEELIKGDVCTLVSFLVTDKDYSEYYQEIVSHLSTTYSKYTEVNENIELIDNYNNIPITWSSSNNEIISSSGIFRAPKNDCKVTLSAYVGSKLVYKLNVNVKGIGVTKALATGYIYTPYNTITQNAMNTLDIIYCAFLDFDLNADFTNETRMTNNINNYIKPLAEKSGTKIVVSINQGPSGAFSAVAASATLREKLATNVLSFIQKLDIDGVDIDWEVPSLNEIENFTLLMKTIYEKVKAADENYLVTAAIGGGKWQPPKYDLTNSREYMDYVNLMTYSMATGNGYYQNALFKSTKGATLTSCTIEESVKIFNDYGIENSKILVGIPFYLTVQTESGGPGSKTGSGKSKWYNLLDTTYALSDTMKEYFDEECGVPYRYDSVNKIFISFENERSIKRKCEYINKTGLAGIMYWQYGQDVDDYLSNAIAKYINGE